MTIWLSLSSSATRRRRGPPPPPTAAAAGAAGSFRPSGAETEERPSWPRLEATEACLCEGTAEEESTEELTVERGCTARSEMEPVAGAASSSHDLGGGFASAASGPAPAAAQSA